MTFMVVQVLSLKELDLEHVARPLHWLFLLLPHYSMCTGLRDLNTVYTRHSLCTTFMDTCITFGESKHNVTINPAFCKSVSCILYPQCCSKHDSNNRISIEEIIFENT